MLKQSTSTENDQKYETNDISLSVNDQNVSTKENICKNDDINFTENMKNYLTEEPPNWTVPIYSSTNHEILNKYSKIKSQKNNINGTSSSIKVANFDCFVSHINKSE